MKKALLPVAICIAGSAIATPFTGNDAASNAMGNTGVASATPQNAFQFNPGLLADYPDQEDFGITLPSVKFFIDDSKSFIANAEQFTEEGGTWDQFQNIDSSALEASISSIPTTLNNIATDIINVQTAIDEIADAGNQGELDAAIADLNTASDALTGDSSVLDSDAVTINTQMGNLNSTAISANDDLQGFSGKPVQLGLGVDLFSIGIPSDSLAMGFNISTTTTIGTSFKIANEDLDPVIDLTGDLTGFTAQATVLTSAVNVLAAANSNLTSHFEDVSSYGDPDYDDWVNELEVREQAVLDAKTGVDTAQADLDSYDGPNGTVVDGAIIMPATDDPQSEIEFVGANISELGISIARRFTIYDQDIAIGITPKLQSINIFEKTIALNTYEDELDDASADPTGYFTENTTKLFRVNFDLGVAKTWDFHGKVRAGAALKDIIPWTLKSNTGTELLIRPKLRIGAAHETQFTKIALDLDITENKPLKYGVPTRYVGIGGEVNAWGHASLRAGYRNNLSVDDSHVLSAGVGITPFGVGVEFSAWAKPKSMDEWSTVIQDAGVVLQLSANF